MTVGAGLQVVDFHIAELAEGGPTIKLGNVGPNIGDRR